MKRGIPGIRSILLTLRRGQRGFASLETAILLVAFVVVASVFTFGLTRTSLFSIGSARVSVQAGVTQAITNVLPKGSMILLEAQSTGIHTGPSDAAILTDGSAGFIAEGVAAGDTIRNITDGSSGTVNVVTATTITLSPGLAGGTENDWDVFDSYEIDMDSVGTIKFRIIPSPGSGAVGLANGATLVFFSDVNSNVKTTYAATFPTPLVDQAYWSSTWLVGDGPSLDGDEEVEFLVNVKNLTTPLLANKSFSIEIIPESGAAISYKRTTPLEITKMMDLH